MDNIKNKDININSVEIKNGKYKITDQDKINYTFWKTKKDGSYGVVYEQWEAMGLDQNSIVSIGYVEEPASFIGKDGKEVSYTDRRIISLRETNATPVTTSASKPRTGDSVSSQSQSDDKFWDKKAYKQCLWNFWLTKVATAENDFHDVWSVFNRIEADADERFSASSWDKLGEKLKPSVNVQPFNKGTNKEEVADDIREMADEMEAEDDLPF